MRRAGVLFALAVLVAAGCRRGPEPRTYQLTGQILGVNASRQEVIVKHDDIPGFMAAMTMPYKVRDQALLDGRTAGDLITATLVVEEADAYLQKLAA